MKAYVASHLKDMNRKNVYQLIKGMESTSKAEISKLTGISAPTVIKIVNFLMEKKIVLEIGEGETAIGRKPHLLTLNTDLMYVAAFVLEGDFFSAGIVDIQGKVIYEINMAMEKDVLYILDQIENVLVDRLFMEAGISKDKLCGIGIALPVFYDQQKNTISGGTLINPNEEVNVKEGIEKLSRKYGVKVYIENDTNAQVLGEYEMMGMPENKDLLFISLGTGLGAGIILGGKLRRGTQYMCGEIGYISYDENYRSDKREWGWLEAEIGYRRLRERFGLIVDTKSMTFSIERKEECIVFVSALLAKCINNITVFLDCTDVVLGGKIVEILGEELIHRVNEYLEHLSINGTRVKMEAATNVGMVGVASLVTKVKIEALLKEE